MRTYIKTASFRQYATVINAKAEAGHCYQSGSVVERVENQAYWRNHADENDVIYVGANNGLSCPKKFPTAYDDILSYDQFMADTSILYSLKTIRFKGQTEREKRIEKYAPVDTPRTSSPTRRPASESYSSRSFADVETPATANKLVDYRKKNDDKKTSITELIKKQFIPTRFDEGDVQMAMDFVGNTKLIVRTSDGEFLSYSVDGSHVVKHAIMPQFKVGKYCFKLATEISKLVAGDIVYHNDAPAQVLKVKGGNVIAIDFERKEVIRIVPTVVDGLNFKSIPKLVCLFDPKSTTQDGGQQMNPAMLFMMSEDDSKSDNLFSLLAMSNMLGADGKMDNNFLMMLMLNGKKEGVDLKQLMMLQMFNNQPGGLNPMVFSLLDGETSMKDYFLMQAMSNANASQANGMNPMMMMALMGDNDGENGNNMMEMMFMSQMLGQQGGQGFNFGNMFGQAPVAPVVPTVNADIIQNGEFSSDSAGSSIESFPIEGDTQENNNPNVVGTID